MTKVDEILGSLQNIAPEVARQMVASEAVSCYAWLAFGIIVLLLGIFVIIVGVKDDEGGVVGFGVVITIFSFLPITGSCIDLYKIKHYPLAYLAEKMIRTVR